MAHVEIDLRAIGKVGGGDIDVVLVHDLDSYTTGRNGRLTTIQKVFRCLKRIIQRARVHAPANLGGLTLHSDDFLAPKGVHTRGNEGNRAV